MQDCQRGQALIRRMEDTFGMRFPEGRNPDIRFMGHLWEPLRWIHSPLAVYVAAEGLWMASSLLLRALGFRPFKHASVSGLHSNARKRGTDSKSTLQYIPSLASSKLQLNHSRSLALSELGVSQLFWRGRLAGFADAEFEDG